MKLKSAFITAAATALTVLALPAPSIAATVFDSGPPNFAFGAIYSDPTLGSVLIGDNFTLAAGATIDGVNFTGGYFNAPSLGTDGFHIRFYSVVGSVTSLIAQRDVIAPATSAGATINGSSAFAYNYTASFSPIGLGAGNYLISVARDGYFATGFPNPFDLWLWVGTPSGSYLFSLDDGTTWSETGFWNRTFQLTSSEPSAVPLPSALPLFATGFGVLAFLARRRKRKSAAVATA